MIGNVKGVFFLRFFLSFTRNSSTRTLKRWQRRQKCAHPNPKLIENMYRIIQYKPKKDHDFANKVEAMGEWTIKATVQFSSIIGAKKEQSSLELSTDNGISTTIFLNFSIFNNSCTLSWFRCWSNCYLLGLEWKWRPFSRLVGQGIMTLWT